MIKRYRFIAIEGIDGAGKRTQLELLATLMRSRNVGHVQFAFPNYQSFFGKMVGQFLNGDFGALGDVDAHFSALLYAGNRYESKSKLWEALGSDKVVISDRYVGSNLAHQTARVPAARRAKFLAWLQHLEYEVYGLPRETVVVYLRVPPRIAQDMVARKQARSYTRKQHDILEASLRHLETAARVYDQLARRTRGWVAVPCADATRGTVRDPLEIHRAVVAAIESVDKRLLRP
jgi:dTMP kinase